MRRTVVPEKNGGHLKSAAYVICLACSLPNLIAGFALAVLQRTFVSRNPLKIVTNLLDSVVWGIPAAALVLLGLLVAGLFAIARPYAALCALVLNVAALAVAIIRAGAPANLSEGVFFLPVAFALTGFALIAYRDLNERRTGESATVDSSSMEK